MGQTMYQQMKQRIEMISSSSYIQFTSSTLASHENLFEYTNIIDEFGRFLHQIFKHQKKSN
jgi:hypothetical protein